MYNYVIVSSEDGDSFATFSDNDGSVNLSIYAGSRFMLSDGFGVFVELDPLFVTAKAGLVFKKN